MWVSDEPLTVNEGAPGDTLVVLDIPESVVANYEWIEEGRGFREFLVPAEVLNR